MPRSYSILSTVEGLKPMILPICIRKLMATSRQVNRKIESTTGSSILQITDLGSESKKCLTELLNAFITKD
jgi:hypothetical protein